MQNGCQFHIKFHEQSKNELYLSPKLKPNEIFAEVISYDTSYFPSKFNFILFPKLEPNEIFAEVISYDTKLFYK